jgi:predicted phage terminase large subunit-like protein
MLLRETELAILARDPIMRQVVPTVMEAELTPQQEQAVREMAARQDFRSFVHLMHMELNEGREFDEQPFHTKLMSFLQRCYDGEFQGADINIPPRFGKTYLVCLWIAFGMGRYPDSNTMYICATEPLANESSDLIRQKIMGSLLYKRLFPETMIDRKNDSKSLTKTTRGGNMKFVGINGQITGFGVGIKGVHDRYSGALVMDDLHKLQEAKSDLSKEEVLSIVGGVVPSRRNTERAPFLVIGQRAALDDIFSKLHQNSEITGPDSTSILGVKFHNLTLTALDAQDQSRWEGGATTEWLHAYRLAKPWEFATQYMQQPYNVSGTTFKVDDMPVITVRPSGPRIACRGWDLAARELKAGRTEPDFTASVLLGYYPDHKSYVIEDFVLFRDRPDVVKQRMKSTAARDGYDVKIAVPQEPAQAGVDQFMTIVQMLDGYTIVARPARMDKMVRAEPFSVQCNFGWVSIMAHVAEAVKEHLRPFPDGRHDDGVDALADAYAVLAIPDEETLEKLKAVAAMQRMAKYTFGQGLEREMVDPSAQLREGYFPEEGEI